MEKTNYTYGMIKPDGMMHLKEILEMINESGLEIIYYECDFLTEELIDSNYPHCMHLPNYNDMKEHLLSKPVLKMLIRDKDGNAVLKYRKLLGSTKSWEALPNTIRGRFGDRTVIFKNVAHGSSTTKEANEEIVRFFGNNISNLLNSVGNYFLYDHSLVNLGATPEFTRTCINPRYIEMITNEVENKLNGESK